MGDNRKKSVREDKMRRLIALILLVVTGYAYSDSGGLVVLNPGFEVDADSDGLADGWEVEIGGGAKGRVELDSAQYRSGKKSLRISNASGFAPFVYASIKSKQIAVQPSTTYVGRFYVKGNGIKNCYFAVRFDKGGEQRLYLKDGDFGWKEYSCVFTSLQRCRSIQLRFASDDVTESLWIDDVSVGLSEIQLTNLKERRYPKDFEGVFPRSAGPAAENLVVYDCSKEPDSVEMALAALQGIVNRSAVRLYMINETNPAGYDELWLKYMQQKGYTGKERRIDSSAELVKLFRDEIVGAIIYDEQLPGSIHAACMLAGIKRALPVNIELAERFELPVVMDLRGKWKRNVDAYRYIYENYWDQMNHHILAWHHPLMDRQYVRDYYVQFNIFTFWMSNYSDTLAGADPAAEEQFINELFAATPANIAVMGWCAYSDTKGIQEYKGVRWMSEYGKFITGEFCSNLSVHSAIRPRDELFSQKGHKRENEIKLDDDKVYISLNILDSGDNLWYWQFYQRKVWADEQRGAVPIGWCLDVGLYETLPLVLQWYYENATANDTFFAAISGLGFMHTNVFASRFCAEDRQRIWKEWVQLTEKYCRRLDVEGIELYTGSWGEPTPPSPETFRYFTKGMDGLKFILADVGRHDNINPSNANYILDDAAIFHTLTRYRLWAASGDVAERGRDDAIRWLVDEIKANTPSERPGFMSTMALSWNFFPSWVKEVAERLGDDYVVVNPYQLARLYKEHKKKSAKQNPL